MKLAGAKKQTIFLTAVNTLVRAIGLLMRMILSRFLGAELMGIAELAQSIHMIAITPLTSGLPVAVSRLTAKAEKKEQFYPLAAALYLTRVASLLLIPGLLIFSPMIARGMLDMRVLPSLWFTAPCILVLGYSASCNGYCYGTGQSFLPAVSELIEQCGRLLFTVGFIFLFRRLTAPWLAAVPVAATMIAECLGLVYVMRRIAMPQLPHIADRWKSLIFRLSWPSTVTRLIQTILRSFTSILIPLRLLASGLPTAEATARLGMLNGMVMPLIMLPCVFTSALSMVSLPRIAQAEEQPSELRRLLGLCLMSCIPVSMLCAGGLYLLAPFFSNVLYRLPELTELFRFCAPLAVLYAISHMSSSILSALGQQTQSMYVSCLSSVLTLGLTWFFVGKPHLRLSGVVLAQFGGQVAMVVLNAAVFVGWNRKHQRPSL